MQQMPAYVMYETYAKTLLCVVTYIDGRINFKIYVNYDFFFIYFSVQNSIKKVVSPAALNLKSYT